MLQLYQLNYSAILINVRMHPRPEMSMFVCINMFASARLNVMMNYWQFCEHEILILTETPLSSGWMGTICGAVMRKEGAAASCQQLILNTSNSGKASFQKQRILNTSNRGKVSFQKYHKVPQCLENTKLGGRLQKYFKVWSFASLSKFE